MDSMNKLIYIIYFNILLLYKGVEPQMQDITFTILFFRAVLRVRGWVGGLKNIPFSITRYNVQNSLWL